MTVGQHKQDVLTGAPVARLSVLARLHADTELKVMTFPAEPYWGSGSYCLGLGPSDGLQCKSALSRWLMVHFVNLLFDFFSLAGQKSMWTSGNFGIFGDKTVEILSLMKICLKTHTVGLYSTYMSPSLSLPA